MIHFSNKYWRIAKRLQTEQLQRTSKDQYEFTDKDLFQLDIGKRGSSFFLGFYSKEGLIMALEKYGVYDLLKSKGFGKILTDIDTTDPYKHKITMYSAYKHKDQLLIELVVRKYFFSLNLPYDCKFNGNNYTGLAIDWLLIQNINGDFSRERPRLPGQKKPGMGLSTVVLELLLITCWRLNLAGIINVPEHYHNADLYSKIFYYFNPVAQAKFLALRKKFKKFPLHKISWGIDWGCVTDLNSGKPFEWFVHHQLVPLHKDLQQVFQGKLYDNYVNSLIDNYSFAFDEEKFASCLANFSSQNLEKCI